MYEVNFVAIKIGPGLTVHNIQITMKNACRRGLLDEGKQFVMMRREIADLTRNPA